MYGWLRGWLAGWCVCVAMCGPEACRCRADGLIDQLPPDGSWVRYQATLTNAAGADKTQITGTITIASVGQRVTEDQGPCRWLEIVSELSDGKNKQVSVGKFLIPDTALARGQNPRNFIVKAWGKDGTGLKEEGNLPEDVGSMLDMLLHGPLEDAKPITEAVVDTKLGKLTCTGTSGSRSRKLGSDTQTMSLKVASRLNTKVPFGVVEYAAKFSVAGSEPPQTGSIRLLYDDSGKDAKSAMPMQD
jgi:hypothetical protein